MSSDKISPFEEIAHYLLGMQREVAGDEGEPYEFAAAPIDIAPPSDIHASNVPPTRHQLEWKLRREQGVIHATLHRSTHEVTIHWHSEPSVEYEFWIEIYAPDASVRPAWFKAGRASPNGSLKSLTIPSIRLGFDPLSHHVRLRASTG